MRKIQHRSIYNRGGDQDTRMSNVMIRFTPEEKAMVRARARSVGYPMSVYVREAALRHATSIVKSSIKDEAIRTLASTGKALKDIGLFARAHNRLMPEMEATLQELLTRILHTIEDIDGRHE